jgi:hypothetical protein
MSRWTLVLWLFVAIPVFGANETSIQPDETFPWWCEFFNPMDHIVSTTVKVKIGGPDATPGNLITGMQIDGGDSSRALWNWTPAGRPNNTTYAVHILAEDSFGSRFACDGLLKVARP